MTIEQNAKRLLKDIQTLREEIECVNKYLPEIERRLTEMKTKDDVRQYEEYIRSLPELTILEIW